MLDTRGKYTLFAALTPQPNVAGPVNCLLFIKDGSLLVSGGDDQVVRVWDVQGNRCLQELRNHRWGQVTTFSWLPDLLGNQTSVLFVGTGRGVVSTFLFVNDRNELNRLSSITTAVFKLNDSVEVQALDLLRSRFSVASHSGQIRMFAIKDTRILLPLWTFQVQDIPRSIFFQGDRSEKLVIHTCCLGDVLSCNADTGVLLGRARLQGGIGSATLSPDGRMKAVYNLTTCDFDVYEPSDSLIPITLSIPAETRLIKQCVFAGEDGRTLVCGGDNGTVHMFRLGEALPQLQSLPAEGPDTFYAVTAFSTPDHHFIACGESEEPATIFVWKQITKRQAAEHRQLRRMSAGSERLTIEPLALEMDKESKALKEKLATMEQAYALRAKRVFISATLLVFLSIILHGILWVVYDDIKPR